MEQKPALHSLSTRTRGRGRPKAVLATFLRLAMITMLALGASVALAAGPGTLVDSGFESGAEGALLASPPWSANGAPQHREYDNTRAETGAQSAWIQGPAVASYAGVSEAQSANMTADGSEVRFWVYQDTTNQLRRFYDNVAAGATYGAHLVLFNSDGTIQVNVAKASPPSGYTVGYTTVGMQQIGWTEYRIVHDFTNQTYTLSTRNSLYGTWTGLKSAGAGGYGIPMRGSGTVTKTGGIAFSGNAGSQFWLDDVTYSATGITDAVAPDTTAPTAPAALLAVDTPADLGGSIDLSWSASTDAVGVTGYRLYRGTASGVYTAPTALPVSTSYTDATAVTNTRYYYAVTALDAAGNESAKSPEFSVVALDNLTPPPPTVDSGFENGAEGTVLSTPPWTAVGTPQHREYDNARSRTGAMSAWIQGPAAASYAGVSEAQSANMTADGSEIRFWMYTDTTNQLRRFYDNIAAGGTYGAHLVLFAADGTIQVNVTKASPPAGYTVGYTTVGTQAVGWTQYRIIHNFSNQTYTLSTRTSPSGAWTPLKSASAATYDIPMRGSSTVTKTGGLAFSGNAGSSLWLDDVAFSATGIPEGPPPADTTPPSAPVTLSALDTPADQGSSIGLAWAAASDDVGVTGYRLYRGTAAGVYGAPTVLPVSTTYTDTTVVTGTRYYYAISAVDGAGNESAKSPESSAVALDNLAPATPAGLTATPGTASVALAWAANTEPDLAGYDVYRGGVKLNTVPLSSPAYTDFGLLASSVYSYRVLAVDTHGNQSAQCPAVIASPRDTTAPLAPETLSAVDTPADAGASINLSWAAASDDVAVSGYKLYRGTAPGSYGAPVTLGAATAYTDVTALTGTKYYYAISALDAAGNEGVKSPEAFATAADNSGSGTPPTPAIDAGFENGAEGTNLATPPWNVVGAPQHREYDNARARNGAMSAWIQGPAAASYAGVSEAQSANMVADGSEIRFWVYQDTTNQLRRFYDNIAAGGTYGAHLVLFAADGTIQVNVAKASPPAGYITGYTTVGTQAVGWTQYRIVHDFSNQTYTLSTRTTTSGAWKPLKSATAATYDIPMRGSSTVTKTGGLAFSGNAGSSLWLDDVAFSATGIVEAPADTTPPTAPATLSALDTPADTGGSIGLTWSAATDNAAVTGYKLYRGTASGVYGAPTTLGTATATAYTATTYTDAAATTGTRYYYAVSALDAAGNEGAKSPEANAVAIDNTPPSTGDMVVPSYGCDTCHGSHGEPNCGDCHGSISDKHLGTASAIHLPADVAACAPCHNASLTVEHNGRKTAAGTAIDCLTCHNSTDPVVTAAITAKNPACSACHTNADHSGMHGSETSTTPLPATGLVCGDCHDADIQVEHARPTASSAAAGCSSCHPTPRDTLTTPWNKTCSQAGCHATGTSTEMHGATATAHTPLPANSSCFGTGCHSGTDLSAIHSLATTTVAGDVRSSCLVCHADGTPASKDCTSCHASGSYHAQQATKHTASPASQTVSISGQSFGPVACADCHELPLLTTVHSGACITCHPTPKSTVAGTWDKSCAQGGCHTAGSTAPMHASIDASHAPVAGQTCYASGCHPATGTDSLAQTHRNASAILGGQTRTSCQVCHWNGTPASRACDSCHADKVDGDHGFSAAKHTAAPAPSTFVINGATYASMACESCHSTSLTTEHAVTTSSSTGQGCATCHPTPRSTLTPSWDKSTCAQGGCHTVGSSAPQHAAINTAHTNVDTYGCSDAGCHTGDLAATHSLATTTTAGGQTRTSCMVCHADGIPASNDCADCHAPTWDELNLLMDGHFAGTTHVAVPASQTVTISGEQYGPVACADCHNGQFELQATHGGYTSCSKCHPTPTNTLTPAWDKSCTQGGCHAPTSTMPMHASIDASHAPVVGQTCYAVGCHPASATDSLAKTHRNASATLGGSVRTGCQVCHWNGTPASRACDSCHADKVDGDHGFSAAKHTAAPAPSTFVINGSTYASMACESCHSTSLTTEHAVTTSSSTGRGCATCHPTPRSTLTPSWDKSTCAQGGCHTVGSSAPQHAAINTAHKNVDTYGCSDAGCHTGDLAATHSLATTTTAGGQTRTSCMVCHADGIPASNDCADCHAPSWDDLNLLMDGHFAGTTHGAVPASQAVTISGEQYGPVACADCHNGQFELQATHGGYTSCSKCHPTPTNTLTPGWDKSCTQGGCHAPTSTMPMHASIDASHAPVAGQTCYASGCHPASSTDSLAKTHRNASATLGGSLRTSCQVCHWNGTPASRACDSCHADKVDGDHGFSAAKHTAAPAPSTFVINGSTYASMACESCHSTSLTTEHAVTTSSSTGQGCATCHPTPRSTLTPSWDKSTCAQGGCHTVGSSAPQHAAINTAHVPSDMYSPDCMTSGCHPGDLASVHSTVSTTTAGGQVRTSCMVCHAEGIPATSSCSGCHAPTWEELGVLMDKHQGGSTHVAAPPAQTVTISGQSFGPVTCTDCHAGQMALQPTHNATYDNCNKCHPTPRDTLTPAWDKSCTQGGCHTAGSTTPMHASIDASHAPVAGQTCYASGCHPSTGTDSLAQTHRNASATLGGSVRTSCQVCHWNGTPSSRACSSCHANKVDGTHGGSHTLNAPGSAYNNTTVSGCTGAGAGCHGDAPATYQAIHPNSGCISGPCHTAANHNDAAFNDPNTCQNCHGGGSVNYDNAPDVVALTDASPGGHYGETTHTATPAGSVSAGGTYSETCSTCHSPVSVSGIDGLYNQHQGLDTLGSTTCADCHNANAAVQALVTDTTRTDTCAACHTASVLPTMAQHGTTAPTVLGVEKPGITACSRIGCHATLDLHALHKSDVSGNANGCTMTGCHDPAKQGSAPTKTSCGAGGDCHTGDPHSPAAHLTTAASQECVSCHVAGSDLQSVHPRGCTTCHNNSNYSTLPAGKRECVDCHTPGTVGTHDYSPADQTNHYNETRHTALDGSAGNLACSDCHSLSLAPEHAAVRLQGNGASSDGTVDCVECHSDPYAKQVINSQWELNDGTWHECNDCHNDAGLGTKHDARPSAHAAVENTSCDGAGCHGSAILGLNDIETIHANAVDSEGRTSCLVCHSNGADTALAGSSCGTGGTCHADKAAGNHGSATAHAFSAASDHNNVAATGCTNSGSGCHNTESTYGSFVDYHPNTGCMGGACHTSASKATYTGNHECVSCHDGNYAGAPDVVGLTGASPNGHYNETTHTPAGMNTSLSAGGTQSATCNDCHNATSATTVDQLFAQHQGIGAVASPSTETTTFTDGFESGFSTPTVWTSADYQASSSGSTPLFAEGFTSATFATGWTASSFTSVNTQNHAGFTGTYTAYATRTSGTGGSARTLNRSTGFNTSTGSGSLTFWQYGTGTVGTNTGFTVTVYNGTTLVGTYPFPTATSAAWAQRTIPLPTSTNARFVFNLAQHASVSQTLWIDDAQVTAGSGSATPEAGWNVQTTTKHSGTSGARAIGADATTRYVTKTGISNTGADQVQLNYSINYASLEAADSLAVETYNGTTWSTAKTYTLTGGSLAWTDEQITGLPTTTTGVRFAFKGDTADDFVYVDDVVMKKVVNGTSTAGASVTCAECHNANAKTISLASNAVAWNDQCSACHNSTDMPAFSANHLTSVPAVTASSTQGCATSGAGCHATSDLHAIHKGNGGAADPLCSDCHDYGTQAAKPVGTTCGVGGTCHNAATYTANDHAKTGNDAAHTATAMTTTIDGTTYNTGGGNTCSDCHSSGLRSAHTTVTATLDSGRAAWTAPFCENCHNSTYAEANSVTTIKTDRWSARTCDQCHVTNGNGKHTTYTGAEHTATTGSNTCTGAGCHATLDVRALHNKVNVGCTLAGTDSFGVNGACHDIDKTMPAAALTCGTGTTGCHTSHAAGNHGPDHNAAQPLDTVVGSTVATYGYGTNVGCFMAGANTGCHFQDLRREHGSTAYLTAQGVAGTERTMNGARGSSADGCTVCHATGMGTAGAYAARTAISTAINNGDYRCTSCHFEASDTAGTTGVQAPHKSTEKVAVAPLGTTAEWAAAAIAQGGGHNSFGAKKFPKTGAIAYGTPINGVTMTGSFGNMTGTWVSGWSQTSDVTCTSVGCHNRATAPNGPQGASVPWYWNNGAAVTGTISTHWYTSTLNGSTTVPTATGCQNCHATLSSTVHSYSKHNVSCDSCHIRIPHAWKRPRLLRRNIAAGGTSTEPVDALPYSDPAKVGLEGYKVTATTTGFSTQNNCNDNCASGAHSASAPFWP